MCAGTRLLVVTGTKQASRCGRCDRLIGAEPLVVAGAQR